MRCFRAPHQYSLARLRSCHLIWISLLIPARNASLYSKWRDVTSIPSPYNHAGVFHSDPHPGNLLVDQDGRLTLIDFGLCAAVEKPATKAMTEALVHLMAGDVPSLMHDAVALEFLYVVNVVLFLFLLFPFNDDDGAPLFTVLVLRPPTTEGAEHHTSVPLPLFLLHSPFHPFLNNVSLTNARISKPTTMKGTIRSTLRRYFQSLKPSSTAQSSRQLQTSMLQGPRSGLSSRGASSSVQCRLS